MNSDEFLNEYDLTIRTYLLEYKQIILKNIANSGDFEKSRLIKQANEIDDICTELFKTTSVDII